MKTQGTGADELTMRPATQLCGKLRAPVSRVLTAPSLRRVNVNSGNTVKEEVNVPPVESVCVIVIFPVDGLVGETATITFHSWEGAAENVTLIGEMLSKERATSSTGTVAVAGKGGPRIAGAVR